MTAAWQELPVRHAQKANIEKIRGMKQLTDDPALGTNEPALPS
jgi:hypothetical protein